MTPRKMSPGIKTEAKTWRVRPHDRSKSPDAQEEMDALEETEEHRALGELAAG